MPILKRFYDRKLRRPYSRNDWNFLVILTLLYQITIEQYNIKLATELILKSPTMEPFSRRR